MSRFYMYDAKTGAYAPVAEFAAQKGRRRKSAPPLREQGGALAVREGGSSYGGSGSASANQKGMGRGFRADKQPRLPQGVTESANIPVNTGTAPGRSPKPYSSSKPPKGGALVQTPKNIGMPSNRSLMQNLVGTSVAGRGLRGLGALGVVGAGALGYNAYKKNKAEAAKSPLRKRYESLRSRLGR